MLQPGIFREYDIRGIAGTDMDEEGVRDIGRGIGSYLKRRGATRVTVGRDCRNTSDAYNRVVIEGLVSTGCHVTDIGVCTTPMSYFSIRHLEKEGSVMVTASHNPPEYNGFKICLGTDSVYGEGLQKIHGIISEGRFEKGKGSVAAYDPAPNFVQETRHRQGRISSQPWPA